MASRILASMYDTYVDARNTVRELCAHGVRENDIALIPAERRGTAPIADNRIDGRGAVKPPYAESVRASGTTVAVRCDDDLAEVVEPIMRQRRSVDPGARERTYYEGGWEPFDRHRPPDARSAQARNRRLH